MVSCRLSAKLAKPTDVVLSVALAAGPALAAESLRVELNGEAIEVHELAAEHGARLHVADAVGPGTFDVSYEATATAPATDLPVSQLDAVRYRQPSRYCESDLLFAVARSEFRDLDGLALVRSVSSWVGQRVAYVSGSSRPTDGAVSTLLAREGVCRDFAHLVVALLRACDVPARVASVYAPGLEPMDFHLVAEALVDGRWLVTDATCLAPRRSLVRIATGRDAADTAFLTTTGVDVDLTLVEVAAATDGPLPGEDLDEVIQLL